METIGKNEITRNSRQSNIELLRIFAAMGVIILHYNNPGIGGGFKFVVDESRNYYIMVVLESAFICAVDLFMIISGYFMCKKLSCNLRKPIELVIQLMVFETVLYLLKVACGQAEFTTAELFGALLPSDYFVILYTVTFILSPYINLVMAKLSRAQLRVLILIAFLLFSVQSGGLNMLSKYTDVSVYGASTYSLYGDEEGYTIVNFILCYMIGAGLRYEAIKIPKPAVSALIYIICVAVISRFKLWPYNEPFVIIEGATAFALFSQLKIKNSAVINKLAGASFTVYLLHKTFVVRAGVKGFATAPTIKMLGHMALTVIGIYMICFVVYVIWSKVTTPIFNAVWKKTGVPEINLETA